MKDFRFERVQETYAYAAMRSDVDGTRPAVMRESGKDLLANGRAEASGEYKIIKATTELQSILKVLRGLQKGPLSEG